MHIPGGVSSGHSLGLRHCLQGKGGKGCFWMNESSLCRHYVSVSLAQLSATIFRKEGLQGWPQFMNLLQHSTHSAHSPEKEVLSLPCWQEGGTERLDRPQELFLLPTPGQVGLLLLSVVVSSQPEAFHAHQQELLQLLIETLSEVSFPGVLFYSLRTLTALARYLRPDDVVRH